MALIPSFSPYSYPVKQSSLKRGDTEAQRGSGTCPAHTSRVAKSL